MKTHRIERVWSRGLPGGGFTAIDVSIEHTGLRGTAYRGALIVERRGQLRRVGHTPPVVAESSGSTMEAVIRALLPTAESNAALGSAILKRQHAHV